ncbi:hypothetical protein GOV14_00450 [Candidatus Pacearchaeota archaeon]|nr:hypothetical protein [Candidatus Pacearchaeota archaeon]
MKKILIVLDGAAGLPHPKLGGKSVIEAANTPNLDFLAKNGCLGYMYPIDEKTVPGSDNSLISIFGNDPKKCRRGVYGAIGVGLKLKKGDLAIRCNFGTIRDLKSRRVVDRRAGRTLSSREAAILASALVKGVKIPGPFEFKSAVQHRGILILKGVKSDKITNVDPEWSTGGEQKFNFSVPLKNDEDSEYAAFLLNNFLTQAYLILNNHPINKERKRKGLLPANFLFTRGGGVTVEKLKKYRNWMSINPMPLEIGISKLSGMKVFDFPYPELKGIDSYANYYKGLRRSIRFAKKIIKKHHSFYKGCYIQFKETDIPGHDNKPFEKKNMLEMIDKKFFGFLRAFAEKNPLKIVVTCDHSTPCILKKHSSHPVPVLVYDGKKRDHAKSFSEKESRKGILGKMYGKKFIRKTGLDK